MNCRKAQTFAALHVGGDLGQEDSQALIEHIEDCPVCADEMRALAKTMALSKEITKAEIPSVAIDFADSVMAAVEKNIAVKMPLQSRSQSYFRTALRMSAAAAAILVFGMLVQNINSGKKEYTLARIHEKMIEIASKSDSELTIENGRIGSFSIEGPVSLSEWEHINDAGIYAVLHKPDPEERPDTYIVDYLGEAEKLSFRGFTWKNPLKKRLLARAIDENNIYVAVFRMPGSSENERHRLARILIRKYKPHFNRGA